MPACPDPAELESFLDELLPDRRQADLADHLAGCTACQAHLERLTTPTDSRLSGLSAVAVRPEASTLTLAARLVGAAAPPVAGFPSPPGYAILRELGRGGMGVVYLARQRGLDRLVALKMVLAGAHASPEQAVRFLGEARIAASLRHPNIVLVHEVGHHDGRAFLAMEYVEGGTLADHLGRQAQPPGHAADLVERLARAVDHAHRAGIVHRDLKPANILLTNAEPGTRNGEPKTGQPDHPSSDSGFRVPGSGFTPKVTDFGLAKHFIGDPTLTPSRAVVGTPQYMAPEQAAGGREVGPAADVWSLGAILYECLAGRPPFLGANPLETAVQVLQADPVSVGRLRPGVPRDLATVCMACLRRDPARRYATAGLLADDLRRFLDGRAVTARPVSAAERSVKWVRRSPAVAGLLGLLVAVAVAGFGLVLWQWGRADDRAADAEAARGELERLSAGLVIDQGAALCDRGDVGPGLLAVADGLARAVAAGDADRERLARLQLAAWQHRLVHPVARLPHPRNVTAVAYSPDGRLAATGSRDGAVKTWDAVTGEPVGRPMAHRGPVFAVAHAGEVIATGSQVTEPDPDRGRPRVVGGEARLWDPDGRPGGRPLAHGLPVWSVALGRGWRLLATGSEDGHARVFLAGTGALVGRPLPSTGLVRQVAISPDGTTLLGAGDGGDERSGASAGLWRLPPDDGGRELLPPGRRLSSRWLTYSPDGRLLLVGRIEDGRHRVLVLDADTGRPACGPLEHPTHVSGAAVSPDGARDATGAEDGPVRVWDLRTGRVVREWPADARWGGPLAFLPDGRTLAVREAGHRVGFRRVADGEPAGPPLPHPADIWAVRFGPDGRTLGTASADHTVREWDLAAGTVLRSWRRPGEVAAPTFRPDGLAVLGASAAGRRVQLWDAATGGPAGPPLSHPASVITGLAFADDGRLAVSAGGPDVLLWDLPTGRRVGPPLEFPGHLLGVSFRPGTRSFAVGGDGPLRVCEVAEPVGGPPEWVRLWVEVLTGQRQDADGGVGDLDPDEARDRRARLREAGGPPPGAGPG